MRITRLTPAQAQTAGRLLQRALDWFRRIREQLRVVAQRVLAALRSMRDLSERMRVTRATCLGQPVRAPAAQALTNAALPRQVRAQGCRWPPDLRHDAHPRHEGDE